MIVVGCLGPGRAAPGWACPPSVCTLDAALAEVLDCGMISMLGEAARKPSAGLSMDGVPLALHAVM
jgi:hypothetical protein